jgi:predicted metal-dependent RNase
MVIISASGMLTGGRVLHHLQAYGPDPYITHGEPDASDALRIRIKRELGWSARVPEYLEKVSLQHPA